MRNPERIPEILKEVADIWKKLPDLRLGQLILNVAQDPYLFYIEDDKLIKLLHEHYDDAVYVKGTENV